MSEKKEEDLKPDSWIRTLMDEVSEDPKYGIPKLSDDEVIAVEEIFAIGLKQTIKQNPAAFLDVVRKKIDQAKTIKSARRVLSEFRKSQKKSGR